MSDIDLTIELIEKEVELKKAKGKGEKMKCMKDNTKVFLSGKFEVNDMLDSILGQLDSDHLLEFIKTIDEAVCDIEFTRKLNDYTSLEMKKYRDNL